MEINNKINKHCLKNVMFINGTAYAVNLQWQQCLLKNMT